ncbi:MAG: tetratricopeptide repeat protein [Spirochaetaceae bacterium]|jgi:tetratricopeptide (TPR) repeat protein|nr:tetratricopeptide repeat protein [Spirochaetaceae bacterium]
MNKLFWAKCALVLFTLVAPSVSRITAQTADDYHQRSELKIYQKNFAGAIEDLSMAIRLRPNDSQGYNARGIVYEKSGNYEAAMADFEYALSLNPHSAKIRHDISNLNNKINNTGKYLGGTNSASNVVPQSVISYEKSVNYQTSTEGFPSWNEQEISRMDQTDALRNQTNFYDTYPQCPADDTTTNVQGQAYSNFTQTQLYNASTNVDARQQVYFQTNGTPVQTQSYNAPANNDTQRQVYIQTYGTVAETQSYNVPVNEQAYQQGYRQTNGAPVQAPVYSASTQTAGANGALSTAGFPGQVTANPVNYYTAWETESAKVRADSDGYAPVNSGYDFPLKTVGNTRANYRNAPVFEIPIKKIFIDPAAEKYNLIGADLNGKGRFDEAIEQFNAAIKVYPGYAAAYNHRGVAFAGKGDLKNAALDFDQALRINPYYYDAQFNRERLRNSGAYRR